jgi:hypothetical protein
MFTKRTIFACSQLFPYLVIKLQTVRVTVFERPRSEREEKGRSSEGEAGTRLSAACVHVHQWCHGVSYSAL